MTKNVYGKLIEELDLGRQAVVVTSLEEGVSNGRAFPIKNIYNASELERRKLNLRDSEPKDVLNASMELGALSLGDNGEGKKVLIEPYYPEPELIVFGGGHVALPLVQFASKAGFKITVIDDRPYFANRERFPEADKIICDSFENCFNGLKLNTSSFVVIVTRGHRHDLICLNQALNFETAYIGMIGSKHRVRLIKEELLSNAYSQEKIDKLHAPIGFEIGALTPEEIAISILAQLISVRRLGRSTPETKTQKVKAKWLEFDREVFEELSRESDEPRAIATIISTKGSVPRHAGAKMIIYAYGRISGSIGGGCCESEVIIAARELIKQGGYMVYTVDMTDEDAEREGMVCGGKMEVLIEAYEN